MKTASTSLSAGALPDPNDLAAVVVSHYARLPQRFRVKPTEWTVLCGIVAQFPHPTVVAEDNSSLKVISLGTGTKCLASASMVDGYVVRDCHAETIARRGLNVVLMEEIQQRLKQPMLDMTEDPWGLFELVPTTDDSTTTLQFRLRADVTLHMFISDSPCGCASEFDRIDGESRRVTGAKKRKGIQQEEDDPLDLRTKSGRSDLPVERQTRCMSCSDKLCKWASVGLQSSVLALSGLVASIRLTSIVLGRDAVLAAYEDPVITFDESVPLLEEAIGNVRSALESSLVRARRVVAASASAELMLPTVHIASRIGFPNSRQRIDPPKPTSLSVSTKPAPSSGVALSWIVKGGKSKREPCSKACGGGFAETIVGVRGVREGASKSAPSKAVASDLVKAMWFQWYLDIHADDREGEDRQTSYRALKMRAKWHRENVEAFRAAFPGWNHNECFDEFHLS